jgi:HTH-type transcriptional regulator / antitoxin HigA
MQGDYRTPAQMIEDHLRARGWTQRVLATVLGQTENKISLIMNGRSPITTELALELNTVLGIDANELMRIQTSYELAKAQLEFRPDPGLTVRAQVFSGLPVAEMIKRGWLKGIADIKDTQLESALCGFFGTQSLNEIETLPHAAKKTDETGEVTLAQLAWLHRVRQLAEDLPAAKYSPAALKGAVAKLKPLLVSPEGVRKVPRIMMEAGVRYVIVECLPAAKIDGVCFWLGDKTPVIGMSLRYDRIDNFWFVLRHEIEHVLQEHGRSSVMLDAELEKERAGTSSAVPEEERIANEAASDFCIPRNKLENFIARKAPMFAERDIRGFAATMAVHPGIVAGQLQHHTGRYELFRNHLAKVREIIAPNAECDGWGNVVPTSA